MAIKYIPDELIFKIYQTNTDGTKDPKRYTQEFIKTAIQEKLEKIQHNTL